MAIGEKTPEYISHTKVHERIKKYLSDVKSIVVLKNPVTPILSHLNHLLRKGHIPPNADFEKVIFSPKSFILPRGFYYKQLTSYFKFFDPEKVPILINEEDIAVNANLALARACNFLEVDSKFGDSNSNQKVHQHNQSHLGMNLAYYLPSFVRLNIIKIDLFFCRKLYIASVSQATIERLYETYKQENKNLFNLISRQVNTWDMIENAMFN